MKPYTTERYQQAIKTLIKNKVQFQEHNLGARRNLVVNGKVKAVSQPNGALHIGDLSREKFASFLGLFSKKLYESLQDENIAFMKIQFDGKARDKSKDGWLSIKEGESFYNIDLKSAYWQIAHKLGYIKKDFYEKYNVDEYKEAKRYCISFLARKNKCIYYDGVNSFRIVECDTTLLKNVYSNIRKMLYICISKAIDNCNGEYIDYNIDAISVKQNHLRSTIEIFKDMDLDVKITRCFKANEKQYYYGSKLRNFQN